jgi:hypothetical protein
MCSWKYDRQKPTIHGDDDATNTIYVCKRHEKLRFAYAGTSMCAAAAGEQTSTKSTLQVSKLLDNSVHEEGSSHPQVVTNLKPPQPSPAAFASVPAVSTSVAASLSTEGSTFGAADPVPVSVDEEGSSHPQVVSTSVAVVSPSVPAPKESPPLPIVYSFGSTPGNYCDIHLKPEAFRIKEHSGRIYFYSVEKRLNHRIMNETKSADVYKVDFGIRWLVLKLIKDKFANKEIKLACMLSRSGSKDKFCEVLSHFKRNSGERDYFVLEMPLYKEDLHKFSFSHKDLPLSDRLNMCLKICECVKSLCEFGYAHTDIKLNNFIVQTGGQIRLIDFGRAVKFGELFQNQPFFHDAQDGNITFSKSRPKEVFMEGRQATATLDFYGLVHCCLRFILGEVFGNRLNRVKTVEEFDSLKTVWKNLVHFSGLSNLFDMYEFDTEKKGSADVVQQLIGKLVGNASMTPFITYSKKKGLSNKLHLIQKENTRTISLKELFTDECEGVIIEVTKTERYEYYFVTTDLVLNYREKRNNELFVVFGDNQIIKSCIFEIRQCARFEISSDKCDNYELHFCTYGTQ